MASPVYPCILPAALLALLHVAWAHAGVRQVLYERSQGDCLYRASHDAVPGQPGVLVINAFRPGGQRCLITYEITHDLVESGTGQLQSRKDLSVITGIFLGRLIRYPWLGPYLREHASHDDQWSRAGGRPVRYHANTYVNRVVSEAPQLAPLRDLLEAGGYRMSGASCEKVLVDHEGLPYDALCWLTIERGSNHE